MMNINGAAFSKVLTNRIKRTQTNVEKTMEKLATGQRIRSSANDAAGLSISQKLLALTRGSRQAIRNVQDANSLVQVADGAMKEMTEIVHRIRELTVQAMNGTNTELEESPPDFTGSADTLIIQNEIDELKMDLNDLVEHTEFNQMKLLTNKVPGEYIYEERTARKTIPLHQVTQSHAVETDRNDVGIRVIDPVTQSVKMDSDYYPSIVSTTVVPKWYIGTTIVDYQPRWSEDGSSIVFLSSRDGQEYVVPVDGSSAPVVNTTVAKLGQQAISSDGLMKLASSGGSLTLLKRSSISGDWETVRSVSYNVNDGNNGYSFSLKVDENGLTSFVYSDGEGNIKKVDVNLMSQTVVGNPMDVIPTTDTLHIPAVNNTLILPSTPNLYQMNTADASMRILKKTDSGERELSYWNGVDSQPTGGYYTVTNQTVTFYGDAIIGNEAGDDAQDYYRFSYISDGTENAYFTTSIPSSAEIYNMHGGAGPRSLNIRVGSTSVSREQLLSARPTDVEGTTGVYVDEANRKIEFYGELRPKYDEQVEISFINDSDGHNGIFTMALASHIDTYNLNNPDMTANRSLRVYVGGNEIAYDETKTNGYTFENGSIRLYGEARPDIPTNEEIKVEYVSDYSATSKDVYGIRLDYTPEIYGLGSERSSIRVFKNGTEEISYSNVNGFQYNASINTIELYGESRPDVNDTYSIQLIVPTGDANHHDSKVEIPITYLPETYGMGGATTFRVLVDGVEVNYDPLKTNGFFYNASTQRIELYGDARPKAGTPSRYDEEVELYYVYESPKVFAGNETYDFELSPNTLDYGIESNATPKAIRVYQKGVEIPYDETNGYTIDWDKNVLSLHGTYRPIKTDLAGDFNIYSITANDLKMTIPENAYVYKVEMNGQEIQHAEDSSGNGYVFDGRQIEIIGDARPDITKAVSEVRLNVQYFESLEIPLDDSMPGDYFHQYCDHESDGGLMEAEIDPGQIVVSMDGTQLTADQYSLQDGKIILKHESLSLTAGNHEVRVDYRVRQSLGYEPNDFTFQVGANAGQNFTVEIASFDNLLRDTNILCVRTHEDAAKGLEVIDHALQFILKERGKIGATENRLDAIASNLSVMEETTTASLSRIQDADMAKEAMNLMKEQILMKAQQAMVSQANHTSSQVLALLG